MLVDVAVALPLTLFFLKNESEKDRQICNSFGCPSFAEGTMHLLPARPEFLEAIRLLNLQRAIFSAREKESVHSLVRLFEPGLSESRIKSFEDVTPYYKVPKKESPRQGQITSLFFKDLRSISETPEQCILIDHQPQNSFPGQEKSLLYCPKYSSYHLNPKDLLHYNDKGYRKIPIYLSHKKNEQSILERNAIHLSKIEGGFELTYVDGESNTLKKLKLSQEGFEEAYEKREFEPFYKEIEKQGGVTKTIFHSANNIYYVAGIIFMALELLETKNIPLQESLPFLQGNHALYDEKIYEFGLRALREINPNLEFVSPKHIKSEEVQEHLPM